MDSPFLGTLDYALEAINKRDFLRPRRTDKRPSVQSGASATGASRMVRNGDVVAALLVMIWSDKLDPSEYVTLVRAATRRDRFITRGWHVCHDVEEPCQVVQRSHETKRPAVQGADQRSSKAAAREWQKELVLIEIERASTRLLKSDGGQHADLTHAIDQIRSWLHELKEHRLAVLDSLGIDRDRVSKVRGIVIAGRDAGNDASHLRRLKGSDHGQVTVLTYDDITAGLAALAQSMSVF